MFIQVIKGRVDDRAGLDAALDEWRTEVRPSAIGFLGSTSGMTADGWFLGLVRFESAAAARANSGRPEQSAWWGRAERCFAGAVSFRDCSEVDLYRQGGDDGAGFVQIMQGRGDRERLRQLDAAFEQRLAELRPDLLGSARAWCGDEYTEAAYFTSEADARAAEATPPPADLAEAFDDWQRAMGPVTYYDLTSPRLVP
jgi:hypothetical protein